MSSVGVVARAVVGGAFGVRLAVELVGVDDMVALADSLELLFT